MLLNEILDKEHLKKVLTYPGWTGKVGDTEYTVKGTGVDAFVYKKNSSPSVVRVASVSEDEKDPYTIYISMIGETAKENPYLPRVSKIKDVEISHEEQQWLYNQVREHKYDPRYRGKINLRCFKLEKLEPLDNLTLPELNALSDKLFVEGFEHRGTIISSIEHELRMSYLNNEYDVWKEPELIQQAFDIIRRAAKLTRSKYDLHHKNSMIRRTQFGFQLVFTDPLTILR